MINFTTETQRCAINQAMTFVTRIFANFGSFKLCVTAMTQGTIIVANKSGIGQFSLAHLASEALGMPASVHCLDDTSNDNITTLITVGRKENTKILLAILATLKLIKDSVLEGPEALGTAKKYF